MSADNWAICPLCVQRATVERQDACDKADAVMRDAYGSRDYEEFQELQEDAAIKRDDLREFLSSDKERFRTFREDYEIYGADEGLVEVSYSGKCGTCGAGAKFHLERPVQAVLS